MIGLALALPRAAAADEAAGKRPNVLVVLCDDLRWDALGCAGNPYVRTPHIDRVAGEGVYFPN
ncbi:MAG TPA: sulfatase-like hydrolase/transferase, partial [Pirellulales bacterium]|nr:sulfatase-like hydrolase/transferase [Pirellulales bacterium]